MFPPATQSIASSRELSADDQSIFPTTLLLKDLENNYSGSVPFRWIRAPEARAVRTRRLRTVTLLALVVISLGAAALIQRQWTHQPVTRGPVSPEQAVGSSRREKQISPTSDTLATKEKPNAKLSSAVAVHDPEPGIGLQLSKHAVPRDTRVTSEGLKVEPAKDYGALREYVLGR